MIKLLKLTICNLKVQEKKVEVKKVKIREGAEIEELQVQTELTEVINCENKFDLFIFYLERIRDEPTSAKIAIPNKNPTLDEDPHVSMLV